MISRGYMSLVKCSLRRHGVRLVHEVESPPDVMNSECHAVTYDHTRDSTQDSKVRFMGKLHSARTLASIGQPHTNPPRQRGLPVSLCATVSLV
jgi:hypothetical protein